MRQSAPNVTLRLSKGDRSLASIFALDFADELRDKRRL
jgi:hypothetical protein